MKKTIKQKYKDILLVISAALCFTAGADRQAAFETFRASLRIRPDGWRFASWQQHCRAHDSKCD